MISYRPMIRISVCFFTCGALFLLLGVKHWAGVSFELGRLLLLSFTGLALLTFVLALTRADSGG